jgi:integrase
MARGIFRRCSCGRRVPEGQRECPREGCQGKIGWAYVVDVGAGRGRKQQYRSGFRTKEEAAAERARVVTELHAGDFVARSRQTLGEYLDRWFASGPAQGWSPNTTRNYRGSIAHIKRRLGHVPMQDLGRPQVRDFCAWLLREGRLPRGLQGKPGPLGQKTVTNVHMCLRAALNEAVRERLIRSNPAVGAYRPPRGGGGEELKSWTLDEMRAFLAHTEGMRDGPLYVVALATGMRRGELLGLRWRDIVGARINVRRQWTQNGSKGWHMRTLKTGAKARRALEVDDCTIAALEHQRARVDAERLAWGTGYTNHDLVFPREDGTPQIGHVVTDRFRRAVAGCAGVSRIVLHGLRHTHATLLMEDGVSLKVVALRLGDRDDTVLRVYGHVTPHGQSVAVARVREWLAPTSNNREQSVSDDELNEPDEPDEPHVPN